MPKLTMAVKDRYGVLGPELTKRLRAVIAAEDAARVTAAKVATDVTRASFKRKREIIPPRRKRSSTGGRFQQHLEWTPGAPGVRFNIAQADEKVPHWIIQELGTGKRATIKQANRPNPAGRPTMGAAYLRTVKAQKGRRISGGLVFASGGKYTPPGVRRDQQLHWASKTLGVPQHSAQTPRGQAASIRIRNEIQGQHFVKKGGEAGFRDYQNTVLAAARQAFRKSNRP